MPGTLTVYLWELRKLRAQKRTYLGLGAAVVIPLIFIGALVLQGGDGPDQVAFGRYVRETGFAIPLVLLLFGSIWLFPLITSLVAGDIVAAEDNNGTLKTILTRSVDRGKIFAAKVLATITYTILALVLMAATSVIIGGLLYGFDPLISLSGTKLEPPRALLLIALSMLVYLIPLLAIAALGLLLSVVTRNSAAAVVGALLIALVLQLLGALTALEAIRPYLLTSQFSGWQGLLREPTDWGPVLRALWVCAVWTFPMLGAAYLVFMRRDVAGG